MSDPARADHGALADAELLALRASGDVEAFGEIVRRHRDRLWAVALRTLRDPEEAADAVQDALVSAFRASGPRPGSGADGPANPAAFRGEAAVTTWLHRIVVNACLDRARRSAVRPAVGLDPDRLDAVAPAVQPVASELSLDVAAVLATLPVEQRAALVLVDMFGWSVAAAAEILDVPAGTVKSRCSRGRARLAPLLSDPGREQTAIGNRERAGPVAPPESTEGRQQ